MFLTSILTRSLPTAIIHAENRILMASLMAVCPESPKSDFLSNDPGFNISYFSSSGRSLSDL